MAAYVTGYDDELFQHPVGHSLHCCICTNVFRDPVMCRRNEHIFCRSCIVRYLENTPKCPTCIEPLTIDTLCEPPRTVTNLLSELKIRCKFFDRGCVTFIELANLESHVRECGFAEAVEVEREPKVVIAGGWNAREHLNSVEMFSPTNLTWTPLQPMKEKRAGSSSVVYNNEMIVLGGLGTKSLEKLSLDAVHADQSITWENIPVELPRGLIGHCSVVYDGRMIVTGGHDDSDKVSDSITEISCVPPYTRKVLATMPQKRCYHRVALFGDKMVILGGKLDWREDKTNLNSVLLYDITKNECKELAPLPYPVNGMATVKLGDDNVLINGGVDSKSETLSKVLIYNVKTQKSHMLPDMKYKRQGCVAAVVKDTVMVMGGNDGRNCLKTVERFRFDKYTWEELPEMLEARCFGTAVVC